MSIQLVLHVAVPSPLHRTFDYLPPPHSDPQHLVPGLRVRVPFGRARTVGVVVECAVPSRVAHARLRPVLEVLDQEPLFDGPLMALLLWAADYYHHPPGEVFAAALPAALRRGQAARQSGLRRWHLTTEGLAIDPRRLPRAPRQAQLLEHLAGYPEGISDHELAALEGDWRGALRTLATRGWVAAQEMAPSAAQPDTSAPGTGDCAPPALGEAQRAAVDGIRAALGAFQGFLLDGVTGSGKTEVYLRVIDGVLKAGRQALVLVPEIGLTPQLVSRFQRRFPVPVAVLHSGLSDSERLSAWLMARSGAAPVVIGTRSAVFVPLHAPGIVIVDEEHDPSLKQQEGFRYHSRDLAVLRAQRHRIPVVLGSATPSLESLHNARQGRYQHLVLPERAGNAVHPQAVILDLRRRPMEEGLSEALLQGIGQHLEAGGQALLFLNRRGYSPTLLCHECGWVAGCARCDARLTLHLGQPRLRCHQCGAERPVDRQCPDCGGVDLRPLGQGTERVEQVLLRHFPGVAIARIDRDSTRRKGTLESLLAQARSGHSRILIGTQMLAKGHHLPDVTLVAVLDADQGLYGTDFRASERMAQLIVQVAGRAGRAEKPGQVLVQTHHPDHPLLIALLQEGYASFAGRALEERHAAGLPPYTHMVLVRAEAPTAQAPLAFLEDARAEAERSGAGATRLLGPVAAPMERRAGRYRAQLLLQAEQRGTLQRLLRVWVPALETLKSGRRVRWSVDVDPVDTL